VRSQHAYGDRGDHVTVTAVTLIGALYKNAPLADWRPYWLCSWNDNGSKGGKKWPWGRLSYPLPLLPRTRAPASGLERVTCEKSRGRVLSALGKTNENNPNVLASVVGLAALMSDCVRRTRSCSNRFCAIKRLEVYARIELWSSENVIGRFVVL
jgi:hypothetical protein